MQASASPPQPAEPEHLLCPISRNLFEEPVLLPCCGQSVSRASIVGWFASRHPEKKCVLCRRDIPDFDPDRAVIVRNLAHEVDEYKRASRAAQPPPHQPQVVNQSMFSGNIFLFFSSFPQSNGPQQWSAVLNPVGDLQGNPLGVSELKLSLENASFTPKPSLFLAVVDRSGSMAGSPWKQVKSSNRGAIENLK